MGRATGAGKGDVVFWTKLRAGLEYTGNGLIIPKQRLSILQDSGPGAADETGIFKRLRYITTLVGRCFHEKYSTPTPRTF